MSAEALSYVMGLEMGAEARLVLATYAEYARPDGTGAWPSMSTVSRRSGLSVPVSAAVVCRLVEAGYLREGDQSLAGCEPPPRVFDVVMPTSDRGRSQ